jgi:hypothetical protein
LSFLIFFFLSLPWWSSKLFCWPWMLTSCMILIHSKICVCVHVCVFVWVHKCVCTWCSTVYMCAQCCWYVQGRVDVNNLET